jgi:hypothetical protein
MSIAASFLGSVNPMTPLRESAVEKKGISAGTFELVLNFEWMI